MGLSRSERWDSHVQSQQELFEGGYNDICILSLSLGATRTFEARKQHDSARFSCEFSTQDGNGFRNDIWLSLHFRSNAERVLFSWHDTRHDSKIFQA
jgi:hypothetical protein